MNNLKPCGLWVWYRFYAMAFCFFEFQKMFIAIDYVGAEFQKFAHHIVCLIRILKRSRWNIIHSPS